MRGDNLKAFLILYHEIGQAGTCTHAVLLQHFSDRRNLRQSRRLRGRFRCWGRIRSLRRLRSRGRLFRICHFRLTALCRLRDRGRLHRLCRFPRSGRHTCRSVILLSAARRQQQHCNYNRNIPFHSHLSFCYG